MKKEEFLWREIDDAVTSGFIYQMDEVTQLIGKRCRVYGTRIFFSFRVSLEQCEAVAHYIRNNYSMNVDEHLPRCITIWHPRT